MTTICSMYIEQATCSVHGGLKLNEMSQCFSTAQTLFFNNYFLKKYVCLMINFYEYRYMLSISQASNFLKSMHITNRI